MKLQESSRARILSRESYFLRFRLRILRHLLKTKQILSIAQGVAIASNSSERNGISLFDD